MVKQKNQKQLLDLVSQITPENKPSFEVVDWGKSVGKEFW
jgi:antitoxin component of MazEF toxin-antitoxin module